MAQPGRRIAITLPDFNAQRWQQAEFTIFRNDIVVKFAYLSLFLLLTKSAVGQFIKKVPHKYCVVERIDNKSAKESLDLEANKFLKPNQVFIYFHLAHSDSITLMLNDSLVRKHFVEVDSAKTGDYPDYSVVLNTSGKKNELLISFKKEDISFKIRLNRKFRIYSIIDPGEFQRDCIYVIKRKYYRIP